MRKYLAVITGAVVGSITLLMIGMIANALNPTPPELMDSQTPEAVAQRVDATSTSTWLTVIVGLSLGAFLGGVVGASMAREKIGWVTTGIGVALSLWAFFTFYVVYPTVLWVPIAMLIAVFVFSYFGGGVVRRSQQKKNAG